MTWEGIIPRKRRKSFEQFLRHGDSQIRTLAGELLEEDRTTRRLMRAEAEIDELREEPDDETYLLEIPF